MPPMGMLSTEQEAEGLQRLEKDIACVLDDKGVPADIQGRLGHVGVGELWRWTDSTEPLHRWHILRGGLGGVCGLGGFRPFDALACACRFVGWSSGEAQRGPHALGARNQLRHSRRVWKR